jgi:hypothetical protein
MAKIRTGATAEWQWAAALLHVGTDGRTEPGAIHTIYNYGPDDYYLIVASNAWLWQPSMHDAYLLARDLAAMPQLLADLCPWCHSATIPGIMCPSLPRWNIYHGAPKLPYPPSLYWDTWNLGPPPGYSW